MRTATTSTPRASSAPSASISEGSSSPAGIGDGARFLGHRVGAGELRQRVPGVEDGAVEGDGREADADRAGGVRALGVLIADQPIERLLGWVAVSADADLTHLDLHGDPVDLTAALVDVPSVSGEEKVLADAVETALRREPHLEVVRSGEAVLARTDARPGPRVLLAGHLDTVPIADNVPSHRDGDLLYGCGTSDMKAGVAVMAHLAAAIREPAHDVTSCSTTARRSRPRATGWAASSGSWRSGSTRTSRSSGSRRRAWSRAGARARCASSWTCTGAAAHSARWWLGENAIHARRRCWRGWRRTRRGPWTSTAVSTGRGCKAVRIGGGVAGNVVPDAAEVTVNFRFAPDRSLADAEAHVRSVLEGFDVRVTDAAAGALPGLSAPAAAEFVAASGATPRAKYGWTDVSRFSALGIPAVNSARATRTSPTPATSTSTSAGSPRGAATLRRCGDPTGHERRRSSPA